ncbi:hypothetical protein [Limimaricola cinnabarinus]|uniref:Uncharacterized protein n=1 Tax=Limimaricola cinnabarinus TaxID=1125964 RepID=A0A2G1MGV6_9RHOB|nr:hypothetical protein [Limimaricola cinnabarinus]PHP27995.1 hypothetical protein CJ301_08395 [Limimaricola cinnabarinus]
MSLFLAGQPDPEAVEAALKAETVSLLLLLELQFASGTKYLSNSNVPFVDAEWGHEWQGMGDMVSIAEISGGAEEMAPLVEYQLALPYELLAPDERGVSGKGRIPALIGSPGEYLNRAAILWGQILDRRATDAHGRPLPVGVPFAIHTGLMDRVKASFGPLQARLTLPVEGPLSRKGAPVYGMLTPRDQARRHPGDQGLRFVPEVINTDVTWTTW